MFKDTEILVIDINIVEIFIVSIYHRLIIFLSQICGPAQSENVQNNFPNLLL